MRNPLKLVSLFAVLCVSLTWLAACSPVPEIETPAVVTASPQPSRTSTATLKAPEVTPAPSQTVGAPGTEGIPLEQDQGIPPLQPAGIVARVSDAGVELSWQGTGSDILVHYIVYRRPLTADEWEAVAIVPISENNQGEYVWTDELPEINEPLLYALTAVDRYGNESQLSDPVRVDPDN